MTIVAPPNWWVKCAGCLAGEPAFILGNGPTLPEDLSCLDGFFSIGVNRILERCTPTVLIWMDEDVLPKIEPLIDKSKTIAVACDIHGDLEWVNTLEALGHPERNRHFGPLTPGGLATVGNSGVTAALWAWSLGCQPVYYLGMSASYDKTGTNFYGDNPHHHGSTLRQLKRAMLVLRHYPGCQPIENAEELRITIERHADHRRPEGWYRQRLAACHTGVYPGERADATCGPVAS